VNLHHAILSAIVAHGRAPTLAELGATPAALRALADEHGVVLHPNRDDIWIAHPFAMSPTPVWAAATDGRGWWAPCAWCGLGTVALVGDVDVHMRLGGEAEPVVVRAGRPSDLLVHFSLPPRRAWDNVVHWCATVQPFRTEAEIDTWCARHGLPRGAAVPIAQVEQLARRWYGGHLRPDWRKHTAAEARAIFGEVGLTGPFWAVPGDGERF
jgi:hypothetical protein